jgi:NAD(P)-dependent dehydrogenase (short-subunit alcohol dehydrogenase family)
MIYNTTMIVTGANSGIGKAAATKLASRGAHVIMTCRNAERGERALNDIRNKTGGSVELMICDLGDMHSIEDFCEHFLHRHQRLDGLINNAGTICMRRTETSDGVEANFGINFLGHFLLTNRLLPLLMKSAPSRIVNVSSLAHRFARLHFDDINLRKGYNWWRGYAQSKLAIVTITDLLSKKLAGTGVTVNSIHPGIVATDIIVNRDNGRGSILAQLERLFFISAEESAEPIVRLAIDEEMHGLTGKYFSRGIEKTPARRARDSQAAEKLWSLSEDMCRLCRDKRAKS